MPWIVRNLLRGTLTFRGLGLSIPPKGQIDLDTVLGRERAEGSNQVLVAFEEGYLQTVVKNDGSVASTPAPAAMPPDVITQGALDSFRASLREDFRDLLERFQVARGRLRAEKERILVDGSLTDSEIKARLACLDEQERELEKNFSEIGRKSSSTAGSTTGSVAEKADLLSSI